MPASLALARRLIMYPYDDSDTVFVITLMIAIAAVCILSFLGAV